MHDDLGSQATGPSDFKIGDWWVRPKQNELEKLDETVAVEGRSMAVLVALARHAPNIVSKERLISEVWSDSPFVSDDVITHAIWELRKALGDSGKKKQYIRTVARKGYGLVAEVLRPQGSPLPLEGARIDHYDLGREIGRGAMGVVFEAVDRRLDRQVAIKFLAGELTRDVKACRRFEREARLAASLDHPNLATVHEIGETSDGHRYLVLPFYSGGSLEDRLGQGLLPFDEAVALIRQLLGGLGVAHGRDIVHRDIKPANLLLDAHGTLKICDFGIAKLLGATDLTETGGALGTPAYKSPEQALGRAVDHRTDLWSVAVVFFELLTGKRPLEGPGDPDRLRSLLADASLSAGQLDALGSFFEKGLAEDVELRFQSAAEMSARLGPILDSRPRNKLQGQSSRPLAKALGLGALLCGLTLAFFLTQGAKEMSTSSVDKSSIQPLASSPPIPTDQERSEQALHSARTHWLAGDDSSNLEQTQVLLEEAVEIWSDSADAKAELAAFLADRSGARGFSMEQQASLRARASQLAQQALDLDESSSVAYAALARLAYWEPDLQQAQDLAIKAIDLERECDLGDSCDLAYVWLGETLWTMGREDEAVKTLQRGARQGGGFIRCHLKLAQLYESDAQLYEAEAAYRQVLGFDQDQTTALTNLAFLLFDTKRYKEAATNLRDAYAQTSDPLLLYNFGVAQYSNQLWDGARASFEAAHRGFKKKGRLFPSALMALGDIELELGKKSLAKTNFEEALKIFTEENSQSRNRRCQQAVCLAKLERFEEARAMIEPILKDPETLIDFPNVLYYAGRIYALEGDEERLFEVARQWQAGGHPSRLFLDDPAFIAYRENMSYRRIVEPEMFLDP